MLPAGRGNTIFYTQPEFEPTFYFPRGEYAYHYITNAIQCYWIIEIRNISFVISGVKLVLTKWVTMRHLGLPKVFGGVCVAHRFNFLCCVICFVCLRPVSCMPNVASVSGLSILDCPFSFPSPLWIGYLGSLVLLILSAFRLWMSLYGCFPTTISITK